VTDWLTYLLTRLFVADKMSIIMNALNVSWWRFGVVV